MEEKNKDKWEKFCVENTIKGNIINLGMEIIEYLENKLSYKTNENKETYFTSILNLISKEETIRNIENNMKFKKEIYKEQRNILKKIEDTKTTLLSSYFENKLLLNLREKENKIKELEILKLRSYIEVKDITKDMIKIEETEEKEDTASKNININNKKSQRLCKEAEKRQEKDPMLRMMINQIGENGLKPQKPKYARCSGCGYEWYTKSLKEKVRCPECHRRFSIKDKGDEK